MGNVNTKAKNQTQLGNKIQRLANQDILIDQKRIKHTRKNSLTGEH
jgi:hypothetical protein